MDLTFIQSSMQSWGFYDFLLPYILFTAIFHAIINKTNIFNTKDEKGEYKSSPTNVIIAMIASFYTVLYTPIGSSLSIYLISTLGKGATVLTTLLGFFIILGLTKIDSSKDSENAKKMTKLLTLLILIGLGVYFFTTYDVFTDSNINSLFVTITVIIIVILYIIFSGKPKKKKQPQAAQPQNQGDPQPKGT